MKHSVRFAFALTLAAALPAAVSAHFKLLEPASWIVENERGDPQKAAPCGGDPKATSSTTIGKAVGGSKIHLKVLATIYHPGHYRVALAVNSRAELPPDPETHERMTEKGPQSVWAVIQSPAQIPGLPTASSSTTRGLRSRRPGKPTFSPASRSIRVAGGDGGHAELIALRRTVAEAIEKAAHRSNGDNGARTENASLRSATGGRQRGRA